MSILQLMADLEEYAAAIKGILGKTTFTKRTADATTVSGTAWTTLLSVNALTKNEDIWGYILTTAGTWAGLCKMRITVDDTKIYPFGDEDVQDTDFVSGIVKTFPAPIVIPVGKGYRVEFRSSSAADGAGETCALTELDVIQRG